MGMRISDTPVATEFNRGLSLIEPNMRNEVRKELWKALGINNRISYYNYRDGKSAMTVPQMFAVWQTFGRYGIFDPWGGKVQ